MQTFSKKTVFFKACKEVRLALMARGMCVTRKINVFKFIEVGFVLL